MKTPTEVLAAAYGKLWADSVVRVLRTSGYIIVRKGAIGMAQDEAVRQYKADNDNLQRAA